MSAARSLARDLDAVVIGTSAGGIDALSVILPALPPGLHAAVFIVLHLPRERPSLLVDIFAPKCVVPVREAEDKQPIERGVVYFAPPDYHLLVDTGPRIALSTDDPVNFSRPSIDVLFESVADAYGPAAVGVVLTNSNHDGAAGAAAIKRAGGRVYVQDPKSAESPVGPLAALAATNVDAVLPLAAIAATLTKLCAAGVR
jgi:two-component system chemotaxis response regulator CheB